MKLDGFLQKGRPPFPVERRPNSLVCASFTHRWIERWIEASGCRHPGAKALGIGLFSPRAAKTMRVERRLAWRIWCVPSQSTNQGHFWECWSRGQNVRLLLAIDGLDRRLSWTPPISMHLRLTMKILLASVLRRIALKAKDPIVRILYLIADDQDAAAVLLPWEWHPVNDFGRSAQLNWGWQLSYIRLDSGEGGTRSPLNQIRKTNGLSINSIGNAKKSAPTGTLWLSTP